MSGIPANDPWVAMACDARPILIIPVFRGGDRFTRCLGSLTCAHDYFAGVVISINGPAQSAEMTAALAFQSRAGMPVALLNTTQELDSIAHTRFWSEEFRKRSMPLTTQLMWLGHDDELDCEGLATVCPGGNWPLRPHTMFLGPWKIRHESVDELYVAPDGEIPETWTCFPEAESSPQRSLLWACEQLIRPTYLNLTGGVFTLGYVLSITGFGLEKKSGMRMEMMLATAPGCVSIQEFSTPITIVYGRADSDRATIPSRLARRDDFHLLVWLSRYALLTRGTTRRFILTLVRMLSLRIRVLLGRAQMPQEEWVVRS